MGWVAAIQCRANSPTRDPGRSPHTGAPGPPLLADELGLGGCVPDLRTRCVGRGHGKAVAPRVGHLGAPGQLQRRPQGCPAGPPRRSWWPGPGDSRSKSRPITEATDSTRRASLPRRKHPCLRSPHAPSRAGPGCRGSPRLPSVLPRPGSLHRFDEIAEYLADKEGVAVGLLVDGMGKRYGAIVEWVPGPRLHQSHHPGVVLPTRMIERACRSMNAAKVIELGSWALRRGGSPGLRLRGWWPVRRPGWRVERRPGLWMAGRHRSSEPRFCR